MADCAPALMDWLRETLRGTTPIAGEPLPSRSHNRSYRLDMGGESYVVKLVHPQRAAAIAHELAILPFLHQRGFPVPDVLAIARDLPSVPETVVLRTHLAGTPAEQCTGLDSRARGDLLAAMGALLARLHMLPLEEVQSFWQFPEDRVHTPADWSINFVRKKVASDLDVLARSGALAHDVIGGMWKLLPRWAARLAAVDIALAPLHGDFYLDNILVTDEGAIAGLLDWEAARIGDPLWEFARTQIASFSDTPSEYDRFYAAYAQHYPTTVDEGRVARYRFLMGMGDLRYAVRHAPALIPERAAYLTRAWRQLVEAPGWF